MPDVATRWTGDMLMDDLSPIPAPGAAMTSDSEPADLSRLDLDTCRARIGEEFRLRADVEPPFVLRLSEARPGPRDPAVAVYTGRPFSLLFRGPQAPVLRQGMHDLESNTLILAGLFVVPLGPDGDDQLYEAVFS